MSNRPYNFYAGPAILPLEVMQEAQENLLNFADTGLSILEISHRSKQFDKVIKEATEDLKEIFNIPAGYHVLFLQGGASTQFAMIPMNLLCGGTADYVNTGTWAKKAIKEAKLFGNVNIAASAEDKNFNYIPKAEDLNLTQDAKYVHITSNETISGTQWAQYPDTGSVPLISDMSSDIMCRPIDISKFGLIYAGAQKNIGPSGVAIVIIKDELVQKCPADVTTMLNYKTHAEKESLFNTPPTFTIYFIGLVMKWLKKQGGISAIEARNQEKSSILYNFLDSSDFYYGCAQKDCRSIMNITFRLKNESLEPVFIEECTKRGFIGLKGHRSVGGCRASIYNAFPVQGVKDLLEFMKKFETENK